MFVFFCFESGQSVITSNLHHNTHTHMISYQRVRNPREQTNVHPNLFQPSAFGLLSAFGPRLNHQLHQNLCMDCLISQPFTLLTFTLSHEVSSNHQLDQNPHAWTGICISLYTSTFTLSHEVSSNHWLDHNCENREKQQRIFGLLLLLAFKVFNSVISLTSFLQFTSLVHVYDYI